MLSLQSVLNLLYAVFQCMHTCSRTATCCFVTQSQPIDYGFQARGVVTVSEITRVDLLLLDVVLAQPFFIDINMFVLE